MLNQDSFKSSRNIHTLLYESPSIQGHQNPQTLHSLSSHHPHLNYTDLSRNQNYQFQSDNLIRPQMLLQNQDSTSFINHAIPEKQSSYNLLIKSPFPQSNFNRCKTQLIQAQSMNAIHSNQRIQMLTKINTILQHHSHQTTTNNLNPENIFQQNKSQLQKQMHAKIDRLESYLHKIKNQRIKEKIPKTKIEPQPLKIHNNPQSSIQKQHKKEESGMSNVFKELDTLKQQIGRVREQAIQVQKRNSVSRDKNLRFNEVESNFSKIKQEIAKINNLHFQVHSQSSSIINQKPQISQKSIKNREKHELISTLRENNHVNSSQTLQSFPHSSSMTFQQSKKNASRSISKPKVTFSFTQKP